LAPTLDVSIALIAIAPFLAAVLAPLVQRFAGFYAGWILAIVPASIFLYLLGFVAPISAGQTVLASLDWVPDYGLKLSFLIDGLSLVFALTISGIGTLIIVYSGAYLKGHPHQGRFFAFMLMFMGAMLGLVLADSTLVLYAFWELTTVTSFLLIGFDHTRQIARRAAIQALVVTSIGGLALLAGAVLLQQATGAWELAAARPLASGAAVQGIYPFLLPLILLAAFTKSAQVPFHFWLPNAMEAPTPVSAFLHSATMVQGGVYLLARMAPILGDTQAWHMTLTVVGGVTLLWGAIAALKQTDLKQMLAQTTIASLGLLVMLLGINTETAIVAALLYFIAHALYKATLFLVAGAIDHETGVRDITALGGLRDKMAASFIATVLAAIAMIGLPPALGFLAKEEMYAPLASGSPANIVLLLVLIAGNGLLAAIALALVIKPFMGPLPSLPKTPHEGAFGLIAGPVILAIAGLGAGLGAGVLGKLFLAPAAAAIAGHPVQNHVALHIDPLSPLFWLSVVTWGVGLAIYYQLERLRTLLRRADSAIGWSFDKGFDAAMFALIRLSASVTRSWHHGRLELYLFVVFVMLALAISGPLLLLGWQPAVPAFPVLTLAEWGTLGLAVIGVITVLVAPTRIFAIVALGVQGLAVALIFLLQGAPDLSFTQFMVEIVSVAILALVMTRLALDHGDPRDLEDRLRDGVLAILCGAGFTLLLLAVLAGPFDNRLSEFFSKNSAALAHGRNIVNVILVDFRGLDTLGEISVVMTAGIAVLALLRKRKPVAQPEAAAPGRKARKAKA
jgi:multicomponent Na+:H+ antiporter subunit A